ncbi:PP2C family protein-serine/threonine phosphatase [Streptomyces indicus]|uniref:GAF domain-containing protein n=1 Tax=Streptomyces indicus TaxID=417292 RepID=A0A1G9BWT1_9ACTN|nr:PP2C family protein-serine/threonine phosphatase [Streptomyces indicus]SDK43938.1 GAF domain-containing protein [Streptomyces indicus]
MVSIPEPTCAGRVPQARTSESRASESRTSEARPSIVVDTGGAVVSVSDGAGALLPGAHPGARFADVVPPWLARAHDERVALGEDAYPQPARGLIGEHGVDAFPGRTRRGALLWWLVDDGEARSLRTRLDSERARSRLLQQVSSELLASLNVDRCMEVTARLAAEHLADAVAIVGVGSGRSRPVTWCVTGGDAVREKVAVDPEEMPGLPEALLGFPPVPSRWIDPRRVPSWIVPADFAGSVAELGSVVVVPLPGHGLPAGAVVLLRRSRESAFTEAEEDFARLFAARAGAALSAARIYAEQTHIAGVLMRDLLPPELARVQGIDFSGRYRAATAGERIGGDFYDVHPAQVEDGRPGEAAGSGPGSGSGPPAGPGRVAGSGQSAGAGQSAGQVSAAVTGQMSGPGQAPGAGQTQGPRQPSGAGQTAGAGQAGPGQSTGETFAVLGDVAGKGLEAAVLTGKIRNTVEALLPFSADHERLLTLLNTALLSSHHTRFATLALVSARREGRVVRLRVTSAGHPAPLIVRGDGTVEAADTRGTLIGALPEIKVRTAAVELAPGETCLLYTDGITEARGGPLGDQMFGERRLRQTLAECAGLPADAVTERVQMLASQWAGERRHDDMALLAITAPRNTHLTAVDGHTRGRFTA